MDEDKGQLLGRDMRAPQSQTRKSGWVRRTVWTLVIIALCIGAYFVLRPEPDAGGKGPHGKHDAANGPVPVAAAVARKGDIDITVNELGTVTPLATTIVHTQISGLLQQIAFREGQMVKQGDFLVQIDPRPYERQLEQYEGQLAKDQAALADSQLDLKRYQLLVSQDSLAKQTLDTQAATAHQNQGAVKTDQAQVDTAKLNLVYCHITAPISGRVGLRQVDLGNYVQPSDANGLVVITQLQPISVIFILPEDNIAAVQKRMLQGAKLPVTVYDRSQTTKLATGVLDTLDNQIDATTGTVKLRAMFDNKDGMLFPQQFVNAELLVDTMHDATIIPSAAVQRGTPGTFVYLVQPDNTVKIQVIKLGPTHGQDVAVLDGLNPGDKVVTDGADKLKDGGKITLPAEHPVEESAKPGDTKAGDAKTGDAKTGSHRHHGEKNESNQTDTK